MKLELQESQFFRVVPPKNADRKVAPGMSVVYTICFTPQENKVLEGLVGEQFQFDSMMDQMKTSFRGGKLEKNRKKGR